MSMVKEFKDFAMKGNLIDMAVGIVIGTAFKAIVSAFVNGVVLPPIGKMLGGVDFSKLFINLADKPYATLAEAQEASAPVITYGAFIQSVIDFLIIAFVIFMVVKVINNMKKKEEEEAPAAPPEPSEEVLLLREIRDGLKK